MPETRSVEEIIALPDMEPPHTDGDAHVVRLVREQHALIAEVKRWREGCVSLVGVLAEHHDRLSRLIERSSR